MQLMWLLQLPEMPFGCGQHCINRWDVRHVRVPLPMPPLRRRRLRRQHTDLWLQATAVPGTEVVVVVVVVVQLAGVLLCPQVVAARTLLLMECVPGLQFATSFRRCGRLLLIVRSMATVSLTHSLAPTTLLLNASNLASESVHQLDFVLRTVLCILCCAGNCSIP